VETTTANGKARSTALGEPRAPLPRPRGSASPARLMPSRMAVKPGGVRYLSPLRGAESGTIGIPLIWVMAMDAN